MSAERRDRRGFEPPPWEKEQFEEFERLKAEESAEQELEAAAEELQPEGEPEPHEGASESKPLDLEARVPQVEPATSAGGDIDPAKMTAMMAGLKTEEPAAQGYWKIGLAVAVFMAVLGSVMLIWGIVALQATRGGEQLGWMGAAVLMFFGVGFIAIAGWVAYKNLQRQGVL